jgi:hypothetical protein
LIPDPGVKKEPDPRSRIRILNIAFLRENHHAKYKLNIVLSLYRPPQQLDNNYSIKLLPC